MIFKIHKRGQGAGAGPVEYLLGKNRDRERASVLRGNPDQTIELIDSLDFARKYTSGVLSFEEPDISEEQKQQIMDSLESHLMAGMDKQQYEILWVQHQDKDRLELNFVIPNVELQTGKRLQPYYDRADRKRTEAWQEITNNDFGLSDPNDPEKRRTFNYGRNLPKQKKEAIETITNALTTLMEAGEIQNRTDVVNSLKENGFNVTRETKKSISITLPGDTRATRLSGAIYEQSFTTANGVREKIEAEIREYRQKREHRVQAARNVYQEAHERKSEYHRERFEYERNKVSRVVKQKHQQLRKGIEQRTNKNNAGVQHGADFGAFSGNYNNNDIAEIKHHQLVDRVNKHERNTEAASLNNQTIGAEIRATTSGTSGAIERLAEAIKRYAETVRIACTIGGRKRENSRNRGYEGSKMRF